MATSVDILVAFLEFLLLVVTPVVEAVPAGIVAVDNSTTTTTTIMGQVEKEAKIIADPSSTAADLIYVSNQGDGRGGGGRTMAGREIPFVVFFFRACLLNASLAMQG